VIYNWFLRETFGQFGFNIGGVILDAIYTRNKKLNIDTGLFRQSREFCIKHEDFELDLLRETVKHACRERIIPIMGAMKLLPWPEKGSCTKYNECQFLEDVCSLTKCDASQVNVDWVLAKFEGGDRE